MAGLFLQVSRVQPPVSAAMCYCACQHDPTQLLSHLLLRLTCVHLRHCRDQYHYHTMRPSKLWLQSRGPQTAPGKVTPHHHHHTLQPTAPAGDCMAVNISMTHLMVLDSSNWRWFTLLQIFAFCLSWDLSAVAPVDGQWPVADRIGGGSPSFK